MEALVVAVVLASAAMHATWNVLLKLGEDRLLAMGAISSVMGLLSPILILAGAPPHPDAWPWLAASAALNVGYFFFLVEAYRHGDLSYAYPLARGSAPLLVAIGAYLLAGERMTALTVAGVALVCAGIASLIGRRLPAPGRERRALLYSLGTGALIAGYTVADGIGVRASGSVAGYVGWLFAILSAPMAAVVAWRRRGRVGAFLRAAWPRVLLAGALSFGSYGLAILALGLGAMAPVSALRETSVVMAAYLGARVLGEPLGRRRIVAACIVAGGVVAIRIGG